VTGLTGERGASGRTTATSARGSAPGWIASSTGRAATIYRQKHDGQGQ